MEARTNICVAVICPSQRRCANTSRLTRNADVLQKEKSVRISTRRDAKSRKDTIFFAKKFNATIMVFSLPRKNCCRVVWCKKSSQKDTYLPSDCNNFSSCVCVSPPPGGTPEKIREQKSFSLIHSPLNFSAEKKKKKKKNPKISCVVFSSDKEEDNKRRRLRRRRRRQQQQQKKRERELLLSLRFY